MANVGVEEFLEDPASVSTVKLKVQRRSRSLAKALFRRFGKLGADSSLRVLSVCIEVKNGVECMKKSTGS